MRSTLLGWIGLALTVVGVATSAFAIDQLARGLEEIPSHWWSTLLVAPLPIGVAVTAIALVRSERR